MDLTLLLMLLKLDKWVQVREGLRKARFVVQHPETKEWFVKFPIRDTPEDFGKAVSAFGRAVVRKIREAL